MKNHITHIRASIFNAYSSSGNYPPHLQAHHQRSEIGASPYPSLKLSRPGIITIVLGAIPYLLSNEDLFEVQRGLNNCFAHDLVPASSVIEVALRASRRVNDYATAVRTFEGIKEKVENKSQYQAYLDELKPVRDEFGMLSPRVIACRHV